MAQRVILIVDDDASHRRMLAEALESQGYAVRQAVDGPAALDALASHSVDLALLDIRMPGMSGMELLERIRRVHAALPVVMVTAHGDVRTAVAAIKIGAHDFLEKPIDIEELRTVAADILERPYSEPAGCSGSGSDADALPGFIVGVSRALDQVREMVRLAADSNSTVLVRGESGTGKELVARAIHELSARAGGPFVTVDCAAVAEGVLESELFGHERGAFTGATARRKGRFELADGGTVFLDEIAEMRPDLQAKLLRVLQERSFERVGASQPIRVDIRVVAATNRDLEEEIAAGRFREDLYYRLAVVEIVIPPLRDRREDILPIAQHLLARHSSGSAPRLSSDFSAALALHDWPGNVRELSNVLERALLFGARGELALEHLPVHLQELGGGEGRCLRAGDEIATGVRPGLSLRDVEQDLIAKTLAAFGGNRTRTAEALGLSRRALLYKMKRYGIR